ncbi:MAG: DUF2252 domain-containing protein [Acidobacteriota bacterium]|nr:DUF2252 domain-containing protein [Acidobacteriota bacterium]
MMKPESAKERFALGQQKRKQMKRLEHKGWKVKQRRESPLKLLEEGTRGRVPSLVGLKNQLMAASPFGYFRGAVPVMAYDLSLVGNTGIYNQLCGDAHVRNLGAFAGADGRLQFDINDFDETIVAPFEWDVKRMATSLILAGRGAGAKDGRCGEVAAVFLERYRTSMEAFAGMPVLELARFQVHRLGNVAPVAGILKMAERATPVHTLLALTKVERSEEEGKSAGLAKKAGAKKAAASREPMTRKAAAKAEAKQVTKGERVFRTQAPMLTRVTGAMADRVVNSLTTYGESLQPERRHFLAQYRPVDVAFKVVGTGSVGLRDYVVYLDGNGPRDPLFLQIKEETASGYAPYVKSFGGSKRAVSKQHNGRRVVDGERAMQVQSDPFLGWTTMEGRDYLVRQLNDHKASIQLEDMKSLELMEYAAVCGELLARGHARAGDAAMIAGYLGTSTRFDEAISAFASAYADQTEMDWKQLVHSLKKGK